jgi:hypothetical protein
VAASYSGLLRRVNRLMARTAVISGAALGYAVGRAAAAQGAWGKGRGAAFRGGGGRP